MAALFALHDWTPPSVSELRALLLTLIQQTRQTSKVRVDVAERERRARTYRRETALVEAEVRTTLFSIAAYADPTDEYPDHSRVIGELNYLTEKCICSFYSEYMSTGELALVVKTAEVWGRLRAGYGYICDAETIVGPNYYAVGQKLFTFDDPVSEVLNDRSAEGQWREVMDMPDKPHVHGKFRDLYGENIVGEAHLRELRRLGLLTDRTAGIDFEPLGPHLFWMTVSPEVLPIMRTRLIKDGLILAGISGHSGPYVA